MKEKILLPVDGSEISLSVLRYGVRLAQKLESEVIVVHVLEPYSKNPLILSQFREEMVQQTEELLETAGQAVIKHAQAAVNTVTIPLEYEIRKGNAAEQILLAASEWGCSMIIIGSHGMSAAAEFILGSVSSKVSLHSSVPVLIVKKQH